jgi:hypothetical protein
MQTIKTTLFFTILFLVSIFYTMAQDKVTLSGYLKDSSSGEAMIGANMVLKELNTGTVTNEYGFFSLTVPKGTYTLVIDYLGYHPVVKTIQMQQSSKIDIEMVSEKEMLKEIVVSTEAADKNVTSNEMSVNQLQMKDLKKMPALLGEVDVIRSLQLLPGVSTVGEGASGFNVRGGSIDQNLILLDDAPVYNSSHLFGFFSVFNPDAVKDVKLYKGAIPAQYGGRLSSLLDVRMKEGNNKRFYANGGIGTVSSRLTLEAPIVKEKGSFIVAARRSNIDLYMKVDPELKNNVAYFYDLSAKANYSITKRDKIFLSGYLGRDVFKFGKEFENSWGNKTATLRWNHIFNARLFANFTGILSHFDYQLGVPQGAQGFDWKAYINTQNIKTDFSYFINTSHTVHFGASFINYRFDPGQVKPVGGVSIFNPVIMQKQYAQEYAAFISNEHKLSDRITLDYGLRYSLYNFTGAGTIYDYQESEPGKQKNPVNGKTYKQGESIKVYHNPEPRLSVKYILTESSSMKVSYNRTAQYIHLLSNTTASSPLDMWTSTSNNIKPQLGDQFAAGYFKNLKGNNYEISVEGFYKYMQHQIDYIDGAQLLLNKNVEADLLTGQGRAYGIELFAKKNVGRLSGWISYTLSRSERKINGISNNHYYRAKYDKPHNLSVVAIYEINQRWSLSSNFTYSSGVTTTFPNSRFEYMGVIVPYNSTGERNNYRLPSYHRLDLSATYKFKTRGRYESELIISLYNVYARKNAYTIYFRQNEDDHRKTEAVRLSILGSVLPSFTYNFKF